MTIRRIWARAGADFAGRSQAGCLRKFLDKTDEHLRRLQRADQQRSSKRLILKTRTACALICRASRVEPPRDAIAWRSGDQCGHGAGQADRPESARAGREDRRRAEAPIRTSPRPRWPGPGFVNLRLGRALLAGRSSPRMLDAGPDYGRSTIGGGTQGQCRICLGQPDRTDACRPLPRRGGRRRAGQPAGLRRLRRHQGILHQRRRRADRRAGALGHAALPRGARRRDRRDPGRASIPATIWCRSGRRWPQEFGRSLLQMPEDEALAIVKDRTIDAMMAMIREDLALLNVHHDVFFSERTLHADNAQGDPLGDHRPDAEGPHLQGQAAAAQGPEAGGLGRPRADAVPFDRGRRRHRPAAGQVGRLASPISPPTSPISRTRSIAASTI